MPTLAWPQSRDYHQHTNEYRSRFFRPRASWTSTAERDHDRRNPVNSTQLYSTRTRSSRCADHQAQPAWLAKLPEPLDTETGEVPSLVLSMLQSTDCPYFRTTIPDTTARCPPHSTPSVLGATRSSETFLQSCLSAHQYPTLMVRHMLVTVGRANHGAQSTSFRPLRDPS